MNISGIPAHNNTFSLLEVYDCCNSNNDVDDNNCIESDINVDMSTSANKRFGMNIPPIDAPVLSNVNSSSSCNFTTPDFRKCKNGITVSHMNNECAEYFNEFR